MRRSMCWWGDKDNHKEARTTATIGSLEPITSWSCLVECGKLVWGFSLGPVLCCLALVKMARIPYVCVLESIFPIHVICQRVSKRLVRGRVFLYLPMLKRKREISSTFLAQASGWVASPINQNRDYRRRCIFWWQDVGRMIRCSFLESESCVWRSASEAQLQQVLSWKYRTGSRTERRGDSGSCGPCSGSPGKWWLRKRNLTRRKMALEMEKGN